MEMMKMVEENAKKMKKKGGNRRNTGGTGHESGKRQSAGRTRDQPSSCGVKRRIIGKGTAKG